MKTKRFRLEAKCHVLHKSQWRIDKHNSAFFAEGVKCVGQIFYYTGTLRWVLCLLVSQGIVATKELAAIGEATQSTNAPYCGERLLVERDWN